jgi:hypothetical protein
LLADSPVRAVLSDAHVEEQRRRAQTEPAIQDVLRPPLLLYAMQPWHTPDQLRLLDADVTRIRDHPTGDPVRAVKWLDASATDGRLWRAGYFETCMKAKALESASTHDDADVAFDAPLGWRERWTGTSWRRAVSWWGDAVGLLGDTMA